MGDRRTDLLGGGLAALASAAFGTVTVLGKIATDSGLAVTSLLALRFGAAGALLFAVVAVRREALRPARGEGARLAALGVAGYAVEAGFFFAALRHGTVSAVTLLFFTYPVWVALMSAALGRGMPGWLVAGSLACAMAGAAIVAVSAGGVDIDGTGILLALLSSVTFAMYLVGAEAVLSETPSLTGAAWVSGSAAAGLLVWSLILGQAELPARAPTWWVVAGMGVATAVAFVALFGALRLLGAVRTSVVSAMEPVAAAMLAVAFLGDPLRTGTVVGGVLILAGAVAASVARGVPTQEPPVA